MFEPPKWDLPEEFADGWETVVYYREGRPPGIEIPGAFRRGVPPTRMDRGAGWAGSDAVWHLPQAPLGGAVKPGDVLRDTTGRRWTVLVASVSASGRAILWTRDWAASFTAAQTVDLEVAETTRGTEGEPVLQWRTFLPATPAQFLSCHTEAKPDGATQVVYRMLLAGVVPQRTLRVKTLDGSLYRVVKAEQPALPGHPAVLLLRPESPTP